MSDKMIALFQSGAVPAHLQNRQSAIEDAMVVSGESVPKISIRGKQFRFIKDSQEKLLPVGLNLEVTIVGVDPPTAGLAGKVYYAKKYVPGSDDPPDCMSANGVVPDAGVKLKQHTDCATCPHNEWGSRISDTGAKVKACSDSKTLLVVNPKQVDGTVWRLQVPPKSFRSLTDYSNTLAEHKIGAEAVITEVSFVDAEFPQLAFKPVGFLDADTADKSFARASGDVKKMLHFPPQISASNMVSPPPVKASTPAPAAAPVVTQTVPLVDPWGDVAPAQSAPEQAAPEQAAPVAAAAPVQVASANSGGVANSDNPYVDASGAKFDPKLHGWSEASSAPAKTNDGMFKARRGTKQAAAPAQSAPAAPAQSAPAQATSPDLSVDDILKDWV